MLRQFFDDCRVQTDKILDALIPKPETAPQRLHAAIRHSIFAGGKRFRPALVLAVGQCFGTKTGKLLHTAAAAEMIHTYSLIHDDLPAMDDDDLRRGRATCHKKFDEATAILAGDVLQTLAFQAVAEDEELSDRIKVKLISELAKAAGTPFGMVAGQQFDLDAEGEVFTVEKLEQIHRSKTGAMICFAARAGAIIAEAKPDELQVVSKYADNLGLLFQITDDLLDLTQPSEVLGKTAGKDLKAEKATYPALYGIKETQNLAENIHKKSLGELDKLNKNTEILRHLADFILKRTA